ncbi:MAG: hypothetical protein SGJ09_17450 [Phycisphaerae bacterium]|nr:hypothetical protein [Phycisphaerae bacterium]
MSVHQARIRRLHERDWLVVLGFIFSLSATALSVLAFFPAVAGDLGAVIAPVVAVALVLGPAFLVVFFIDLRRFGVRAVSMAGVLLSLGAVVAVYLYI